MPRRKQISRPLSFPLPACRFLQGLCSVPQFLTRVVGLSFDLVQLVFIVVKLIFCAFYSLSWLTICVFSFSAALAFFSCADCACASCFASFCASSLSSPKAAAASWCFLSQVLDCLFGFLSLCSITRLFVFECRQFLLFGFLSLGASIAAESPSADFAQSSIPTVAFFKLSFC